MNILNKKIQPGMALGVQRPAYKHYCIYAGEINGIQYVIHYSDDKINGEKGRIELASLRDFQQDDTCWIEVFNGIEYSGAVLEISLARAVSRIGEQKYDAINNNCEHLATWCVTGESRSRQVEEIVAGLILAPREIVQAKIAEYAAAMLNKVIEKHPLATLAVAGTILLVAVAQRR